MKYALVENGIVQNVIICDAKNMPGEDSDWKPVPDRAGKGWTYNDDGSFAPPDRGPLPPKSSRNRRQEDLNLLKHPFPDGRTMQVRPKDEANIRNAIEVMTREGIAAIDWVMLDNKKYSTTLEELQEAFEAYQFYLLGIWDGYDPQEKELKQFNAKNPPKKKD